MTGWNRRKQLEAAVVSPSFPHGRQPPHKESAVGAH